METAVSQVARAATRPWHTDGRDELTDGISDDPGLVSLNRPGMWKFSLDFIPKRPVLFLNLYNNQWNTNYRYWYQGTWSWRGRLWTFGNGTVIGEAADHAVA